MVIGGDDAAGVALLWEDDGCRYTVWLPPGVSPDAAREYAARY
jgi:hypothetical protein